METVFLDRSLKFIEKDIKHGWNSSKQNIVIVRAFFEWSGSIRLGGTAKRVSYYPRNPYTKVHFSGYISILL